MLAPLQKLYAGTCSEAAPIYKGSVTFDLSPSSGGSHAPPPAGGEVAASMGGSRSKRRRVVASTTDAGTGGSTLKVNETPTAGHIADVGCASSSSTATSNSITISAATSTADINPSSAGAAAAATPTTNATTTTPDAVVVHGLVGWFTSDLYRGIYTIDTRLTSPSYNAFHWEGFFFSTGLDALRCNSGGSLVATVSRHVRDAHTESESTTPLATEGAPDTTNTSAANADDLDRCVRTTSSPCPLELHYEWSIGLQPSRGAGVRGTTKIQGEADDGVVSDYEQEEGNTSNPNGTHDKITLRSLKLANCSH
jgi:hypothetical protein